MGVSTLKMMKNIKLRCLPLFVSLLLTSCKQTVIINGAVVMDDTAANRDIWEFITSSLIDWTFAAGLVFTLFLSVILWKKGHNLLEWFKNMDIPKKIVIAITALAFLITLSSIPQTEQHYGFWFAIPVTLAIVSTIMVIGSVAERIHPRSESHTEKTIPETFRRQRNLTFLAKTMVWVWTCGWVVYFVAIGIAKQPHVGAEVLLRSAIASLSLFFMNIDSNILDAIHGHDVLKGMIVCAGFAAVLCTAILIMSLVLSRLMAYIHIRHIRIDKHLYVFFGLNDASRILAKTIYREDPQSVIVFIENNLAGEDEQDEDKTDGWKNILCMLTHRRKTFIDAEEDERRALAIAGSTVCSLEGEANDVWGSIGLESVKRLLTKLDATECGELHIFFLSEDRESNVRSSAIIAKDKSLNCHSYKTTIYCHARRDGVNRIIEDMELGQNIEIRLLDSSHLAVESLKRNVENHPVSFVDIETMDGENPGTVTSPFTSLVVGFGETGQEAVKFLYEFGAFVNSTSSADASYRSPFSCHVVDNNMVNLEGQFISSKPYVSFKKSDDNAAAAINFYKCDYRSIEFYEKVLAPIADKLNYVIVAMGDDELNITVAVEILRYVRLHRTGLDNFCIYVRAYEKGTFRHLQDIAEHYNMRLDAKTDADKKIRIFGQNQELYTYKLVVKDRYKEDGRKYYETYRSLKIAKDDGSWENRHKSILSSNEGTKWERMSKLRRKESQDFSNALHADTKLKILNKALGSEDSVRELANRILSVSSDGQSRDGHRNNIQYKNLSHKENRLMLNMAMLEHLRWNAAHEMMGYTPNENEHGCNELTKQHNCLKAWEKLDHESTSVGEDCDYQLYDFGVVETTLKQAYWSKKK